MKYHYLLLCIYGYFNLQATHEKIIGLIQVKNEATIVEYALKTLALYTDAIVVLDDCSEDATLLVIKSLSFKLNIVEIISNKKGEWVSGSEVTNRQKLLEIGRKHGGTHFIEIDADEIISKSCLNKQWLRKKVLSLQKGQILQVPLINLWKGFDYYRSNFNNNFPNISYCSIAYCDDPTTDFSFNLEKSFSTFLHFDRFPHNPHLSNNLFVYESNLDHSLIHLPFVNWRNAVLKKTWFMMLEIIRLKENLYNKAMFPNGRTEKDIEDFYNTFHNYDDQNPQLSRTPDTWLSYSFFSKTPYITRISVFKLKDIQKWNLQYGYNYFMSSSYLRLNLSSFL